MNDHFIITFFFMFLLFYGAKFIFRICFLRDNLQYIYSLKFKFCFALKIFSRNLLLNICVVMLSKKKQLI